METIMNAETTAELDTIVRSLGDFAHVARKSQFAHAATLLEMAKLELQMAIFDISYDELEALRSIIKEGPADQPVHLDAKHLPKKVVTLLNQLAAAGKPDDC
jgi:hypothetical protein